MDPSHPEVLLAATGGGLFLTKDGALSWSKLIDDYTRATIIHPGDPAIAFAGPAPEVGRRGRIIQSTDGGETWQLSSNGLSLPMDDMVESFVIDPQQPESVLAICSEGRLLQSDIRTVHWQLIRSDVNAQCLAFAALA
jgi:hypothetical protein